MDKNKNLLRSVLNNTWVKPYLKQNKRLLLLVLFLGVATFFCAGALMFSSGYLISKSATQPENILLVYVPIVLVRTFGIFRPVFKYFERLTSHNLVLQFLSSMRVRLYRLLESQALTLKSRYRTGDLLGVLADDLEHLQNLYLKTIFPSIIAIVIYCICVIALGFYSIPFALLMALFMFVLVVIFPLVSLLVTRKRQAQKKQARNNLYQTLADAVMGISDWKISGRQADFLASYEKQENDYDQMEYFTERFNRNRNFLFQIIVTFITVAMIWFSASSVENGTFEPIWIAAFVLVVFPIVEAFAPIPEAISQISGYDNSLTRINKLEETPINESASLQEDINHVLNSPFIDIKLEDVTFSYSSGKFDSVLKGVSLQFRSGEQIALLGKSGAGKSTMAKLLLGALKPDKGKISFNDISVLQLQDDIAKLVAVLNQKPHLFDSTVMNNIRLGNPEASDEEVIEVTKQVRMHEYITSLPDGYNTRMRELGARFSGGERQRIALARILLQKTPIVILDEPTIGLDAVTERKLLNTIFQSLNGKTVLWITHHLVGVEQMDRILFLEGGEIKMEGTHKQLLRLNERYRNLYRMDRPLVEEDFR